MPGCLVLSGAAERFAEEIARAGDIDIPVEACTTVAEALHRYSGQSIVFGNPDLVAAVLPELPAVDWVQSTWAGVKPLCDIARRDYVLTGVKDVFGPQIAEYVLGYLLAYKLKVHERMARQRKREWYPASSGVLQGKRLGVMGTGSIGSHVSRTARSFGMKVTGLSRSGAPSPDFDHVEPVSQLHSFLEGLDFLVTTLPQTASTDKLLDRAALGKLPSHAYVINVGRGNVIDDDALVDALESDALAGAALDVFNEEPLAGDSRFWNAPNLTITAHIAAISHPSLIAPIFVDNYRRYVAGQPLAYVIDLDRGY